MTDIGAFNEKLVLQTIRSAPQGIGQSDVVRLSHLSRQAVSLITRRLMADGLVEQAGRRISGPGKPHTLLRVVADARLAIGVHLDPAHIAVVICDLAARPVARTTLAPPTEDPRADLERVAAAIAELSRSLGASVPAPGEGEPSTHRRLLGIGIAAPAGLDADAGILRDPPWIPGWRDVPVVDALSAVTGLPATLDKDTNAALTGEIWSRHLETSQTVLYMYVGHGVGSAVSGGGRVHRGGTTQAGEIGHLPIGRADQHCICGRHGCLCLYTDAHVLVGAAHDAGVEVSESSGTTAALEALSAAAAAGSAPARDIIGSHAGALGEAMRILAGVHDPQRIIIGGPTWPALRDVGEAEVRDALGDWLASSGGVVESSHLGDDVGAIGAASLFLEQELAPGTVAPGTA
ncbi:ROK family transcriptional regulator [Brachybacterium sacelli]|uniref:NBD/HSP70 family sugar kinase n=2 Tax=Brachybacterium sacelli TaxID=173364 RepID=A0ABS4X1R6_9MICO|nr:ROK family protein [Brachybacterium sacelli]MBP2382382.1 putative NBD/HSP70 family sugar kinase [Brachybacterium sacelli]